MELLFSLCRKWIMLSLFGSFAAGDVAVVVAMVDGGASICIRPMSDNYQPYVFIEFLFKR